MIYAKPGATYTAVLNGNAEGLVGTLTVQLENSDGTTAVAATKAGIVEVEPTVYAKDDNVAPTTAGTYILVWDNEGERASEELVVTGTGAPEVEAELLERVKERVETDLEDAELQRLVNEALAEIEDRYGPPADSENPITVQLHGETKALDLLRPIDTAKTVKVVEEVDTRYGLSVTELEEDDYRVWNDGRTLQRLVTGTNSRRFWGQRVEVTYVPQNDGNQRQEVVIQLVKLALEHDSVSTQKVGDVQTGHLDYAAEREKIITGAAPRKGLMIV